MHILQMRDGGEISQESQGFISSRTRWQVFRPCHDRLPFGIERNGQRNFNFRIRQHGYQLEAGAVRAAAPTGAAARSLAVTADVAGIFLTRHPWGGGKLPGPGDRVQAGEVVGLLQIGLLLAPVLAPVAGRLGKTLLSPGAQAGYGTRLMEIFGGDS